jgi:hypothetical protein
VAASALAADKDALTKKLSGLEKCPERFIAGRLQSINANGGLSVYEMRVSALQDDNEKGSYEELHTAPESGVVRRGVANLWCTEKHFILKSSETTLPRNNCIYWAEFGADRRIAKGTERYCELGFPSVGKNPSFEFSFRPSP